MKNTIHNTTDQTGQQPGSVFCIRTMQPLEEQAPVKPIISEQEKKFLDLLADNVIKELKKQVVNS